MKLMRWAMCLAAFAFAGEVAKSEDYVDIGALQAKLAAQEARLNDLQAKVYGNACDDSGIVAEGITSLRKNATVTIGGTVNTRYDYVKGKIETRYDFTNNGADLTNGRGGRVKVYDNAYGSLGIADAKLEGKIDVNDFFDAYFKFDLQDGTRNPTSTAQNYWVRWKNVCNTGFGLLVGRDGVKFGGIAPYGRRDNWVKGIGDQGGSAGWGNYTPVSGLIVANGMPVRPAVYDDSRTVQITPYWETQDGRFKAEVSFFQSIEHQYGHYFNARDGYVKERAANDGVGSFSARLTWKPIDGLTVMGSILNLHAKNDGNRILWAFPKEGAYRNEGYNLSRNNFATNIGFEYRPAFFNKLNLFATWTHGWNDAWIKDQSSNSVSFGFGVDVTSNLTLYATADHVNAVSKQADARAATAYKASGWANEIGLKYTLPYGVWIDAGWRHERMTYKNRAGEKHTKLTSDNWYTTLGFDF